MKDSPTYTKIESHDKIIYNLSWSDYILADKFTVIKKFSEMTGIYVVFYINKYKRLEPILLGSAWYTGFRPILLRLFTLTGVDPLPKEIINTIKKEKAYIKYIEVYNLDDQENILYKLKEKYSKAFFDTNGLPEPEDLFTIKLNDPTKIYYKKKHQPDI